MKKIYAQVKGKELVFERPGLAEDFLSKNDGKRVCIEVVGDRRTDLQNNSLHLYFTLLAEKLNAGGFDMRKVIREDIDIPWSAYSVKENLWRPVQEAQLGKKSTTELNTKEIDLIYDTVNRAIGTRTGISIPFPSIEQVARPYPPKNKSL